MTRPRKAETVRDLSYYANDLMVTLNGMFTPADRVTTKLKQFEKFELSADWWAGLAESLEGVSERAGRLADYARACSAAGRQAPRVPRLVNVPRLVSGEEEQ